MKKTSWNALSKLNNYLKGKYHIEKRLLTTTLKPPEWQDKPARMEGENARPKAKLLLRVSDSHTSTSTTSLTLFEVSAPEDEQPLTS